MKSWQVKKWHGGIEVMHQVIVHLLVREEKAYCRMQEIGVGLPIGILRVWNIPILNRPANAVIYTKRSFPGNVNPW
jgi:hypothetical protein